MKYKSFTNQPAMNQHCLVPSLFGDKKNFPKLTFKPFVRTKECKDPDIVHFEHPSCCNEDEYVAWRSSFMSTLYDIKEMILEFEAVYMKPMLDYDKENPVPRFKGDPCTPGGDHVDHIACCSFGKMAEYIQWFEKTQLPFGFNHRDFYACTSKEWPWMHLSQRNKKKADEHMSCSDTSCTHCTVM